MCGIICTIKDITHSFYDLKPPFLCHHTHYIWHRFHCVCVITSIVFMISHQLYFWDHIRYNSWHYIHCIRHDSHWLCAITHTRSMISHPNYVWHHTSSMYNIVYPIWGITPIFYEITPHYVWHHMHCIPDITPSISDMTSTLSVSSRPVYQLCHTNSLYDITHTLCMTSQSVCMASHEHFMMSHPYRYDITKTIFMTS